MILQALNRCYDRLVENGKLERPGWQPVKVSFALQIDDGGNLKHIVRLGNEEDRGKKKVWVPLTENLPAQEKRSVGIVSNFLCDNATYILGLDTKGKPDRAARCFQACRERHEELLSDVDSPPARAVLQFFASWDPASANRQEILKPFLDELSAGGNLIFDYQNRFLHQYPEIQQAWDRHYGASEDKDQMLCLVTGRLSPVAVLHPNIKGVAGGQPTGTALVSFNAPAFESYGHNGEQGRNAPIGEEAAFAYTSALNYMIANRSNHLRLSDATIVFWAEHGEEAYAEGFSCMMGDDSGLTDEDLLQMLRQLSAGRKADFRGFMLDPGEHFYVLGLSPNAARLSVRFFLQDSFGTFAENLLAHHERLRIIRPAFDQRASLSFWYLLNETVNQKARDKTPSPLLSGSLIRSVLMNQPYPQTLLSQVEIRIRAEREITRGRAAIIKAFLLRQAESGTISAQQKEALTVELNDRTTYQPYLLGRLFAVLEGLQQKANPGINTTIRDRYFNSACATPAVVFPQLIKLAQAHLKKLDDRQAVYFNRQIGQLLQVITQDYPARLSLYDQGIFQLGYYHQTQSRYTKKEDKENE